MGDPWYFEELAAGKTRSIKKLFRGKRLASFTSRSISCFVLYEMRFDEEYNDSVAISEFMVFDCGGRYRKIVDTTYNYNSSSFNSFSWIISSFIDYFLCIGYKVIISNWIWWFDLSYITTPHIQNILTGGRGVMFKTRDVWK